ncbi:MAG: hypothetical protein WDM84_09610 [Bauldia sp.]
MVWLPDTYYPNDNTRAIAPVTPSRAAAGLPQDGFVFCSFNNNYKITPEVFDIWMKLLGSVGGQRAVAAGEQRDGARQSQTGGCGPRRCARPPHFRADRTRRRASGTPPARRSLPRHVALQRPHDRLRRAVGGIARGHLRRRDLHQPRGGEPAVGGPPAGTGHRLIRGIPRAGAGARTGFGASVGPEGEACGQPGHDPRFSDTARFTRHLEAAFRTMMERHRRGEAPAAFAVEPAGGY